MEKIIATADCETNPFKQGREVYPFVWGFYNGSVYSDFWGPDCTERFIAHINEIPIPMIIYAHNGGKFDWLFIARHFRGSMRVIGSRIVQARIGIHEFRDSFANLPVPLRDFGNKQEVDYAIMEPGVRDKPGNRTLISSYLQQDCIGLYDGITAYRTVFGNSLTMASAAMKKLNLICTGSEKERIYEQLTPKQDHELRPFYRL
jgi:hypothetical protein